MSDERYMCAALAAALDGLGQTWPNPSVGCVIIKNGEVIAQARTANGGRPHAETLALKQAGARAEGASVYVNLEPCAHKGKTGPCAEALVKAKVAEVVIGCMDSDPRVSGRGIKILREAGIKVTSGILEKECRDLNKGFFKKVEKALPYVMLKAAISADGKYLKGTGTPRWITGEKSREDVHRMRASFDAILTGTGTVLADNPQLNCRIAGLENRSPVKVVTGNRPLPGSANIFKGKEVWLYPDEDLPDVLEDLAKRGITRLMAEAGPKLSNALLAAGLVDEVIIFQSPDNLGEGDKFFAPDALSHFIKVEEQMTGTDRKLKYLPAQ